MVYRILKKHYIQTLYQVKEHLLIFIIDPNSSVTENISNVTQKSQLEGAFDSMEGIVKEATMFMSSASDFTSNNQSYATKSWRSYTKFR